MNSDAATDGPAEDVLPEIATDGAGNWVAVWQASDNFGDYDWDIEVSRSTDNGETWSPPEFLNSDAATEVARDTRPQVATDGAGNWVAVWTTQYRFGDPYNDFDWDIAVSRSTDNGETWSPPEPLNGDAATDVATDGDPIGSLNLQSQPLQVATDGTGNWVAVWTTRYRFGSEDWDIAVSRSTDNGATWSPPQPLNSDAATDNHSEDGSPQVATDGAGNWVAVWTTQSRFGDPYPYNDSDLDIAVSRSTDNGATWSPPEPLNPAAATDNPSEDAGPHVATDGAGNWVAVWQASKFGGYDLDIAVSRSTDNGATWSPPEPLNTDATDSIDWDPRVTTDGAGNWVAVWTTQYDPFGDFYYLDIAVSRSTDNGVTWSPPEPLNTDAATDNYPDSGSEVATDGAGNWVAVWTTQSRFGGYDLDIAVSRSGILYAALGDSFSSGEGVPDFLPGTDVPGTNECHRSPRAYGFQIEFPGVSLGEQEFLACSGARTFNVGHGGTAPVTAPGEPPQLDQVYDADPTTYIVDEDTDMVTITIGGNDAGFEEVLKLCASPFVSCESGSYRPYAPVDTRPLNQILFDRITQIVASRVSIIYSQIKGYAPDAAVFVLGYPRLFGDGGCSEYLLFNEAERQFLNNVSDILNSALESVSSAQGVHFVGVSFQFSGHEACTAFPWVHGLNPVFNREYSFHPNSFGQKQYAKALDAYIVQQLAGGTPPLPTGLPENPHASSLGAVGGYDVEDGAALPSFGRLHVEPAEAASCDSHGTYVGGQSVRLTGSGFGAGEQLIIRIAPPDANVSDLATTTADAAGGLNTVVSIPTGSPTGDATLQVLGLGADGAALLLVERIGLSTSFESDVDGDGVPDPCDSCPIVSDPNTTDSDADGVADPCDECPNDFENDLDRDGLCADVDPCEWDWENDADADGHCENADNCPVVANPDQQDWDGDGTGDACDTCTDTDRDTFGDPGFPANTCDEDNCPNLVNPTQVDGDGDGVGDVCDVCPSDFNPAQADGDGDGLGDECDLCPTDAGNDQDGDLVCAQGDNCPALANASQIDTDGDSVGDVCDTDPIVVVPTQAGTIQEAVDLATESGTRIELQSGLYQENVIIDREMVFTIVAAAGAAVVVDGQSGTAFDVWSSSSGRAPMRFAGLTIRGATGLSSLVDTKLTDLTFDQLGFALYLGAGRHVVEETTFQGGAYGIWADPGTRLSLERSTLRGLTASAISVFGTAQIVNSLIAECDTSISVRSGGTLDAVYSTVASATGVGIDNSFGGTVRLDHVIAYGNDAGDVIGVSCTDIQWSLMGTLDCTPVNGNLHADPLFAAAGDYRLQSRSPALDIGPDPATYEGTPCDDIDGGPRLRDWDGDRLAQPDVGAYENDNPLRPGPGEVANLRWNSVAELAWDAEASSVLYRAYRTTSASLGYADFGACIGNVGTTVLAEPTTPSPGEVLYYVITGEDASGGESAMGFATCAERSNFSPCPDVIAFRRGNRSRRDKPRQVSRGVR